MYRPLTLLLAAVSLAAPSLLAAQPATRAPTLEAALAGEVNTALASPELARQLSGAARQFPALVAATKLFIAYASFDRSRRLAPDVAGAIIPPIGPPRADICAFAPTMCRCRQGDREACLAMVEDQGGGGPQLNLGSWIQRVRTCAQLRADYAALLEQIIALLRLPSLTGAQLRELARLQTEANAAYADLVARGCLGITASTSGATTKRP